MRAGWPAAWAALLLLPLAPGLTAPLSAEENFAERARSALSEIQARDQALQDIGWRLAAGNAPYCDKQQLSVGLQLLDLATFPEPAPIRLALDLEGDFAVHTAAAGSPAQKAGLMPNAEVVALEGRALAAHRTSGRGDWQRLARLHDAIDDALQARGEVTLTMIGGETIRLTGVPACATRFELADGGKRAVADGKRVQIGSRFPAFVYAEDEFAAAIAHELAHNLLGHSKWLERVGRSRNNIRTSEREADRLMPWLLANAGYDPQAALRFMERWGPRHAGGIFRKRTHEGWDERAEHIAAELEGMRQYRDGGNPADWRQHFVRETGAE